MTKLKEENKNILDGEKLVEIFNQVLEMQV